MDHKNEFKKCFPDLLSAMLSRWIRNWNKIVGWRVLTVERQKYGVRGWQNIYFIQIDFLRNNFVAIRRKSRKKNKNSANVFEFENCDIKIYMPEKNTPNTIAQMALTCINTEVEELSSKISQIFFFFFFAGFYLWKVSVRLLFCR